MEKEKQDFEYLLKAVKVQAVAVVIAEYVPSGQGVQVEERRYWPAEQLILVFVCRLREDQM